MLFIKTVAALGMLATTVLADGASIVAALNAIDAGTAKLNNTVVSWDGQLFSALPILSANNDLLKKIQSGKTTADQSAALSTDEAVQVYYRSLSLATDVNITLTSIEKAKPKADKSFTRPIFLNSLKDARNATAGLTASIKAKVPENLQGIAQNVADQYDASFAQVIALYSQGGLSF